MTSKRIVKQSLSVTSSRQRLKPLYLRRLISFSEFIVFANIVFEDLLRQFEIVAAKLFASVSIAGKMAELMVIHERRMIRARA